MSQDNNDKSQPPVPPQPTPPLAPQSEAAQEPQQQPQPSQQPPQPQPYTQQPIPPYAASQQTVPPMSPQSQPAPQPGVPPQPQQPYTQPQPQPTPPQPQPAPPRKSRGWIVAVVIAVVLLLALVAGLWSCTSAIASLGTSSESGAEMLTSEAVGVITIDGTIDYDGTTCSPEGLKEQLDAAAENSNIVAVVLRVNSGGGTATAGEEMATYVREFCENTGKPVVVSSGSINASAAYEISSQADYIFVAKSTAIGSIGTALQIADYSDLLDTLGISIENITSADSKDSSYGTRELTEEERQYYQNMVDEINNVFIQNVVQGRGMSQEEVQKLATGLPFTGIDAVQNGLADEVGTKEDAVKKAATLAGSTTEDTIALEPAASPDWEELLDVMSNASTNISAEDLANALKELENNDSLAH